MMVTHADNRGWPDDISLEDDHTDYGLTQPSLLRVAKVASIEIAGATPIGKLHGAKLELVRAALLAALTS